MSRQRRENPSADLARAAKALDPTEAVALASEALPLDNEVLEDGSRDDEDFEHPGNG